jgi:hypothetical protein
MLVARDKKEKEKDFFSMNGRDARRHNSCRC